MEAQNIFIVGCPRTGTSLLREILNRSERICITPETHFLHRLSSVGRLRRQTKRIGSLSDDPGLDKFIGYVYADHKISAFWQWLKRNIDQQDFKQRLLESDRSEPAIFSLLMQIYAEGTKGGVKGDLILGEKTPAHLYYVPTLLEWFPQAKIIHTFRDPRAITVSRIKKVKKNQVGLKSKYPFLPEWLLDPLDTPVEIVHMSQTWFNAVHLHHKYEQLYPHHYHLVRFEDLISEPEEQIRQICDFLDISFESEMLEGVVVVGSSYQPRHHGPRGFDQKALERWRENLNPLVSVWFSALARKQLKKFGYVP